MEKEKISPDVTPKVNFDVTPLRVGQEITLKQDGSNDEIRAIIDSLEIRAGERIYKNLSFSDRVYVRVRLL